MKTVIDHITFAITEQCNLCCEYCFEKKKSLKNKMSFEIFKYFIELLCKDTSSGKSITFFGGEPLICSKEVLEWSRWLSNHYPNVSKGITTNGVLLTKDIFDELENENISVLLSIDGYGMTANSSRYDNRNICVWNDWIKNVRTINNKELLNIRMTITTKNVKMLFYSVKAFINLGIKNIAFALDYYDDWKTGDIEVYKEQFLEVLDLFFVQYRINNRVYIDIIERLFLSGIKNVYTKCRLISDSLTVLPNGSLKVCHRASGVFSDFEYAVEKINTEMSKCEKSYSGMRECDSCVLKKRCTLCLYLINQLSEKQRDVVCMINQFHIKAVDDLIVRLYDESPLFRNEFFGDV